MINNSNTQSLPADVVVVGTVVTLPEAQKISVAVQTNEMINNLVQQY